MNLPWWSYGLPRTGEDSRPRPVRFRFRPPKSRGNAGSLGYGMDTSQDDDPERTLLAGISAGNGLLEFAQSKVPELTEDTRRVLSTLERTGGKDKT